MIFSMSIKQFNCIRKNINSKALLLIGLLLLLPPISRKIENRPKTPPRYQ